MFKRMICMISLLIILLATFPYVVVEKCFCLSGNYGKLARFLFWIVLSLILLSIYFFYIKKIFSKEDKT